MRYPKLVLILIAVACFFGCSGVTSNTARNGELTAAETPKDSAVPKTAREIPAPTRPGNDWPIFLGPHGDGKSDETGLLDKWPDDGPAISWQKKIGKGYSSPSIKDNRLVVHHRLKDRDLIECLQADTGTPIWSHHYDTDYVDPYGYNNGPRCSPLLTETRCYTFGAQGRLVCLDLKSGEPVWERDTAKDWNVPAHFFGAGCTPILDGDNLIVLVGGQPNSGVVAMNAETGKTVWESVGQETWNGAETDQNKAKYKWTGDEMIVSYSSPIVATIHGEKHLLCLMRQGLVSLNPVNGELRFKYWFRARVHESVNAARPVIVDDMIFLSAAYETGAALLKVKPDNKSFDVVWRNKRGMSTHWSTPVYRDGCIYGFSGRHEEEAMLQCVDLLSGNLLWETNGYEGPLTGIRSDGKGDLVDIDGNPVTFFGRGSKTAADGKYFVLGERGVLVLAKINREKLEMISRVKYPQIHYPAWASPVLSRGYLYLRSEDYLLCLDVRDNPKSDK